MKLNNKFFWIKIAVIGLGAFSLATDASRFVGVNVSPSVEIANRVAPTIKNGLQRGGNALWNNEVEYENKDFYGVNFEKKENDFEEVNYITQAQEVEKLEARLKKERDSWESK